MATFHSVMFPQNWRFFSAILVFIASVSSSDPNQTHSCSVAALPSPGSGSVLKWRPRDGVFQPEQEAVFICEDDYRQIDWLPRFTCGVDGTWSNSSAEGYCQLSKCNVTVNNTRQEFKCVSGEATIDLCHKCDCIINCPDGSDEESCGAILYNVTGKHQGNLATPNNPRDIHLPLNCSYTLWTDDPGRSILLDFNKFKLRPDCKDYVYLSNEVFVDPYRKAHCELGVVGVSCAFCGGESPPLARSLSNWLTLTLHMNTSTKNPPIMSATWYNVIKSFPSGIFPQKEEVFSDYLKEEIQKKIKKENSANSSTQITASGILGCLIALLAIILVYYVMKKVILPRNPKLAAWLIEKQAALRNRGAARQGARQGAPSSASNKPLNERTPLRGRPQDTSGRSPTVEA